ncbi:hypothetical protein JW826_00540 [Candidatus Woesearchaeota archaeon]|nr:hypothetical protein [Candidatus Woesearchaeota archaeon]
MYEKATTGYQLVRGERIGRADIGKVLGAIPSDAEGTFRPINKESRPITPKEASEYLRNLMPNPSLNEPSAFYQVIKGPDVERHILDVTERRAQSKFGRVVGVKDIHHGTLDFVVQRAVREVKDN